jgi:hypothetical protein
MTEDRQPMADEEPTLNDPADKTQPAEGGRDEVEEGDTAAPGHETETG